MKNFVLLLASLSLSIYLCAQKGKPHAHLEEKIANKYYPFEVSDARGELSIRVNVERQDILNKYGKLFEKYEYSGNGYCWEGHIKQILGQIDKSLLSHIEFDPEAGGFYAYADSKASQAKFVKLLSPIFSDLEKLEAWIKRADRSEIDD